MNPIDFLKAFFSLGILAWWVLGGMLLLFGFIIVYLGMQSLDIMLLLVGLVAVLIGILAIYRGTALTGSSGSSISFISSRVPKLFIFTILSETVYKTSSMYRALLTE